MTDDRSLAPLPEACLCRPYASSLKRRDTGVPSRRCLALPLCEEDDVSLPLKRSLENHFKIDRAPPFWWAPVRKPRTLVRGAARYLVYLVHNQVTIGR